MPVFVQNIFLRKTPQHPPISLRMAMNKEKLKGGCFPNIPPNSHPNTHPNTPNTNLQENEKHDSGMQFIKGGFAIEWWVLGGESGKHPPRQITYQ